MRFSKDILAQRKLMKSCLIFFVLIFSPSEQLAAQSTLPGKLSFQLQSVKSDIDRIIVLQQISDYYFALKNEVAGDSIFNLQLVLAYESNNQNLVLKTLFENKGLSPEGNSAKKRNEKTHEYIQRALDYAKTNGLKEYEALAWSLLAKQYLLESKKNEALETAQFGLATAMNSDSDSAKVVCQLMVGLVYLEKADMLMAFKSLNIAMDIAENSHHVNLKTLVQHMFAFMYKNKLGQEEVAKKYAFQSLAVNKKNHNIKGLISDFILLGKMLPYQVALNYFYRAESLADSIEYYSGKIEAQRILFFYMTQVEKPGVTFAFINNHPDLKALFQNTGPHFMDYMNATVYAYGGMVDSALISFRSAEESFKTMYDPAAKSQFFNEYVFCLMKQKDSSRILPYAELFFQYSKDVSNYFYLKNAASILQKLYEQKGDFKKAYDYSVESGLYKDSIDLLTREKDFALMEIDNVNKKNLADADLAKRQMQKSHNLQYLAITVIILTVFIILIIIGMFKVSAVTIRAMGFLSLVFLFEFVILLLDNWIHHITHGEPWKVWLIKIAIISFLLPLHQTIEEKLINYLLSKKIIVLHKHFKLAGLKRLIKKSPPAKATEGDQSGDEAKTGKV